MKERRIAPRTPFTTEFRGGTRAVQERLCNLFTGVKRRGTPLVALTLALALLAGGLVACTSSVQAANTFDVPDPVFELARDLVPDISGAKLTHLAWAGSYSGLFENATVDAFSYDVGVPVEDPDGVPLVGGQYVDEDGLFHEGPHSLLAVLSREGNFTFLADAGPWIDGPAPLLLSDALRTIGESRGDEALTAAGEMLFVQYHLDLADEALGWLTGAAPCTGDTYTDGAGVVWLQLAGYEKWHPDLRVDDQVLSQLYFIFPRELAVRIMQQYVYTPDGLLLERDGRLWMRQDAIQRSFWPYTADRDTLAVVEFTSARCVFTMEGTDHDEPATWVFTLDGKESNIVWLFTQYYTLSS